MVASGRGPGWGFGVLVALGAFGRGGGWWFAGVLGTDRGGGLGALLQLDFSSVVCA